MNKPHSCTNSLPPYITESHVDILSHTKKKKNWLRLSSLFNKTEVAAELIIKCLKWSRLCPSSPSLFPLYSYFMTQKLKRVLTPFNGEQSSEGHQHEMRDQKITHVLVDSWEPWTNLSPSWLKESKLWFFVCFFLRVHSRDVCGQGGRQKKN